MIGAEKEGPAIAIIVGAITVLAIVEAEILALRQKYTVHSIVAAPSALGKCGLHANHNKGAQLRVSQSVRLSAREFDPAVAGSVAPNPIQILVRYMDKWDV